MAGIINSRRRWFGLLFLLLSVGLLVWGQTWLRDVLKVWGYIVYWTVCLLVTLTALVLALLDARSTRRAIRARQLEILKETFGAGEGPSEGRSEAGGQGTGRSAQRIGHSDD